MTGHSPRTSTGRLQYRKAFSIHLRYHRAGPVALAVDLLRSTNSEPDTGAAEQRSRSARVDAGVEVEVGSVLVRARQTRLRAKRVAARRAEVGDLDHDAVAGV